MGMKTYTEIYFSHEIEIWSTTHSFAGLEKLTYYGFTLHGQKNNDLYNSAERAIIEAIAAKYCGTRGAGGTGVDTAGGWFAKMIGMNE